MPSDRSKTTAGLLAIFLGTFGIHKFYMGQVGKGILFILLSHSGISTVVSFIQGIVYLFESEESFAERLGESRYDD